MRSAPSGPSLGQDSIRQGITSFIVGGALVIVFMIAYYKGAGLVAVVAVIFNIFYMLAILAGFQAVFDPARHRRHRFNRGHGRGRQRVDQRTHPEELRAGRTVRSAIEGRLSKRAARDPDSNVTTFLSGVILFQFGTGPIKGFAVTLCVGILTTVITAVYLTRTITISHQRARKLERISI